MTDSSQYKLIRAKRRTIALIVEHDGSLTVRAPRRVTLRDIEHFIHEKFEWVVRTREKMSTRMQRPKKNYENGETFLLLGVEYPLSIVKPQRPALKFDKRFTLGSTAQPRAKQVFSQWYKRQAFTLISERVNFHASQNGFAPNKLSISSAKTRWGSCSSSGNLSFTWRLIMAPLEVVDYVVFHELAHLRVKNHSKKFWELVESLCPDYRSHRKWLRDHGDQLTLL